jgi:hypothetical protein
LSSKIHDKITINCFKKLKYISETPQSNLSSQSYSLKYDTLEDIQELFKKNLEYPIPLVFGKKTTYGYEIDHWFILYKDCIYGSYGGGDKIEVKFKGIPVTPEEFHKFLKSMVNTTPTSEPPPENFEIFKSFFKKYFFDKNSVVKIKQCLVNKFTASEIDHAIDTEIDYYRTYANLYNYDVFLIHGYWGPWEPYVHTLRDAIICLTNLPIIDAEIVPTIPTLKPEYEYLLKYHVIDIEESIDKYRKNSKCVVTRGDTQAIKNDIAKFGKMMAFEPEPSFNTDYSPPSSDKSESGRGARNGRTKRLRRGGGTRKTRRRRERRTKSSLK